MVDALNQQLKLPSQCAHDKTDACGPWLMLISLVGVTFQMHQCHVRCVQGNILLTIGWLRLLEEHKPPLLVPPIVDVHVDKKIHTFHGLWIHILWYFFISSNFSFKMCRNHVICVKIWVDATCHWPTSHGQCMQGTTNVVSRYAQATFDEYMPYMILLYIEWCCHVDAHRPWLVSSSRYTHATIDTSRVLLHIIGRYRLFDAHRPQRMSPNRCAQTMAEFPWPMLTTYNRQVMCNVDKPQSMQVVHNKYQRSNVHSPWLMRVIHDQCYMAGVTLCWLTFLTQSTSALADRSRRTTMMSSIRSSNAKAHACNPWLTLPIVG